MTISRDCQTRHPNSASDFYRTFTLADTIEAGIAAELNDGVLTVHLPKRADTQRRKIEVKVA